MEEATLEVVGTRIEFEQDYVSLNAKEAGKLNVINVKNSSSLMGDREEVEITQRYLTTYKKFKLWKERNKIRTTKITLSKPLTWTSSFVGL